MRYPIKRSFLALALNALALTSARASDGIPPVSCQDINGQPVVFLEGGHSPDEVYIAASTYEGMNPPVPVIYYDPVWMSEATETIKTLVLEHECVHHREGHVLLYGNPLSLDEKLNMEIVADCGAIATGKRKYGYGQKEVSDYFAYLMKTTPEKIHWIIQKRQEATVKCLDQAP